MESGMRNHLFLWGSLLAGLSGCISVPSQQEASAQYYGSPIEQSDAEAKARQLMAGFLKDPDSAQYQCALGGQAFIASGRAWGGHTAYGYALKCGINAKNSYGAYGGAEPYAFLFLDGTLIRAARSTGGGVAVFYGE